MMLTWWSLNWTHKWWKLPSLKSPITLAHSSWLPGARREILVLVASGHNYRDWVNVCHLTLDPGSLLTGCQCHSPTLSLATEGHPECDSIWYLTPWLLHSQLTRQNHSLTYISWGRACISIIYIIKMFALFASLKDPCNNDAMMT